MLGGLALGPSFLSKYCSESNFQISPRCWRGTPEREKKNRAKRRKSLIDGALNVYMPWAEHHTLLKKTLTNSDLIWHVQWWTSIQSLLEDKVNIDKDWRKTVTRIPIHTHQRMTFTNITNPKTNYELKTWFLVKSLSH